MCVCVGGGESVNKESASSALKHKPRNVFFSDGSAVSHLLLQLDGGSDTSPSSRSQRIARAKWEFLFGGQGEDSHRTKGADSWLYLHESGAEPNSFIKTLSLKTRVE